MKKILCLSLFCLLLPIQANDLPYDFQAYDFCEKYVFTDRGVLITVHRGDDLLMDQQATHGEILLKPGTVFQRFVPGRSWIDTYTLTEITSTRAYFSKERNVFVFNPARADRKKVLLGRTLEHSCFFLPKDHYFGWIGWLFPTIEIHPGDQAWRTR